MTEAPPSKTHESVAGPREPASGAAAPSSAPADESSPAVATGWRAAVVRHADLLSWVVAAALSVAAAVWVGWVQLATPIPAGGDPGNWIATSYPYVGRPYPSQVIPLAYPPLLFPLLGGVVLVTGGALPAARAFPPLLMVLFGLSVFALARRVVVSRSVALLLLGFLVFDPGLLAMFFWGAYPNLLAFVFLHLALLGLLLASRTSSGALGALLFWVFLAATLLTHSLVGLAAVALTVLYGLLALSSADLSFAGLKRVVSPEVPDGPQRAMRSLVATRGGWVGALVAGASIGGYYGYTALAHIPHPAYLVSGSSTSSYGLGLILRPLLPGLGLTASAAFYTLILADVVLLAAFAAVRALRPRWLTPPVLLLWAWGFAATLMPVGGRAFSVITDYHRFGFLFIVPVGLALAYALDTGWVSHPVRARGSVDAPPPTAAPDEPFRPPSVRWRSSVRPRRALVVAVAGAAVLLVLLDTATAPALAHDERTFTRVGHDAAFLGALDAIKSSGVPGGVLTVPGADKWVRAVDARNAFAPRAQTTYLFYPSQVLDSQLAYYALTERYAVTNGLVSLGVRGTNLSLLDGVPAYGAFNFGALSPVLRLPPASFVVVLRNVTNGSPYSEGLTTPPLVSPPNADGGPLVVAFDEPGFRVVITLAIASTGAAASVVVDVRSTGADPLVKVEAELAAPTGSAGTYFSAGAGAFEWQPEAGPRATLRTLVNVTPAAALRGYSSFSASVGGPAVLLEFRPVSVGPSTSIVGSLELATPGASARYPGLPYFIDTPELWRSLDVGLVLMPNATYLANPRVAVAGEIPYLEGEYGCSPLYVTSEWTVLRMPSG